jgi:hypothetical protein
LRWYDPSGPALTEMGSATLPDLGSITHLEAAVGALFVLFWTPSGMQLVRVDPVPE